MPESVLEMVVDALGKPSKPRRDAIPASTVVEWMRTTDLEALGALQVLISDPRHAGRIVPRLSFDAVFEFTMRYSERCILENPQAGQWASSCYLVGHDLVRWFLRMWDDPLVARQRLGEIKSRLARLHKSGDIDVRECIVNGILEHLFERNDVAAYFIDWKADSELGQAYDDALLWSRPD